jgi:alcohol dehydrogenase class IV
MLPALVIADPELTIGLPPAITAAVGMDALSHNLEAFCAPFYHPMADGIALEGMRLIKQWLPIAVADGANLEARAHMMIASSMGATAFQKGLGAMHSLSHPCSAHSNTHHGLTNAVVMPYVLVWNRAALQEKMLQLSKVLGLQHGFIGVLEWILELRSSLKIPATLHDLGIREQQVATLAECAMQDPSTAGNPLPMTVADFTELYRNCLQGRL